MQRNVQLWKFIVVKAEHKHIGTRRERVPEDLVQHLSWRDRQLHVSLHVPLPSLQIHHILVHVHMYENQHNNIGPTDTHNFNHVLNYEYLFFWRICRTWLKKSAKCASSTAWSMSASSHIMKGDFPPSSRVTGFRLLLAASWRTVCPVSVDPVKASWKN